MRPVEGSDSRPYTGNNSSSPVMKERVYFNESKKSTANFERMAQTEAKVEGYAPGKVGSDWTSPSFLQRTALQPTNHKITHIQRDTSGAGFIMNKQGRSSFLRSITG